MMTRTGTEVIKWDDPRGSSGVFKAGEDSQIGFKWTEAADLEIWHLEARAHNLLKMQAQH
jgi:hypothetical protein